MHVIFDRQHYGKPNRNDMGAGADLDQDGKIEIHEQEASLTPFYIEGAREWLAAQGHTSVILDSGWYSSRHEEAVAIARKLTCPVAYIACHLNAGGGSYASSFYDARSSGGKALAEHVTAAMSEASFPGVSKVIHRAAESTGTWRHAYNTIKGIYAGPANLSGLCFEPLFMDHTEHQKLLTEKGLQEIGRALARGCLAWSWARS